MHKTFCIDKVSRAVQNVERKDFCIGEVIPWKQVHAKLLDFVFNRSKKKKSFLVDFPSGSLCALGTTTASLSLSLAHSFSDDLSWEPLKDWLPFYACRAAILNVSRVEIY